MADLEDTPIEGEPTTPVEDAQGAPDTEAPPWGDDFDAGKAWNTITKQRESEKQLKERLRLLEEDDDAFAELARKRGYEIQTETPDDDDDGDDELQFEEDEPKEFRDPRVDQILEQQRASQIRADLDKWSGETDWELDDDDRRRIELDAVVAKGNRNIGQADLQKAFGKYIARLDRAVEARAEPKPKPTPPHVTQSGTAAVKTLPLDATPAERQAYMAERVNNEG